MAEPGGRLDEAIVAAASDTRAQPVVLMHLLIAAGGDPGLAAALDRACAAGGIGVSRSKRLERLAVLLRDRPEAARIVAEVMAEADHTGDGAQGDAVARWTRVFDRLSTRHGAACVALYSLGSEDLLAEASAEVVGWIHGLGLAGPGRTVLDLGCGIGRLTHALAPSCGLVVGADVSAGMLRQAASRDRGTGRTAFVRTNGRDLSAFADASFDLVLACDVFPYLVQAGPDLARAHFDGAARVLRPRGDALVLNLSYRGDESRDRTDAAAWASSAGLQPVGEPEKPFSLWDATAWRWRKPC